MKILICGEGGQGVQIISQILAEAGYDQKYFTSYIPHYGVEMRMGISFGYIQLSKTAIAYPKFSKADILAMMTEREIDLTKSFIGKETRVINGVFLDEYLRSNSLSSRALNMLILGIIIKELNVSDLRLPADRIKKKLAGKLADKKDLLDQNLAAYEKGLTLENEIYTKNVANLKNQNFTPIIDKDNKKTHIKFPNLCKGCALCVEKCPVKALSWDETKINYIKRAMPKVDINKCISCMICENICPDSAITIIKK